MKKLIPNPLVVWHEKSGLSWEKMGQLAGLSKNSMMNIRQMSPEDFGRLKMTTVAGLTRAGIDVIGYFNHKTNN
jgi:hypothetical protein